MFTLKIKTENAEFEGDAGTEIARILRQLAGVLDGVGNGPDDGRLLDANGNTVGEWKLTAR